jgi:DNA-binding IscR family transcriptional regulator
MTHQEILLHLQANKDKLNIAEMAKQIGISKNYLTDVVNERKANGRIRKIHKKHFDKIIGYLNSISFN